jgi:hypothetical protein
MVWWPFAPKPERADTLEVTDLHSGAPPLYSTRLRGEPKRPAHKTVSARLSHRTLGSTQIRIKNLKIFE